MSEIKHEKYYQIAVFDYLQKNYKLFKTASGKQIRFISPGFINSKAGPDFRNMALFIDGKIYIGDGEFHKKSSDWFIHKHDCDFKYKKVILEIVFTDNSVKKRKHEILILNRELFEEINNTTFQKIRDQDIFSEISELRQLSLNRIKRKAQYAGYLISSTGMENALRILVSGFIDKYSGMARRPVNNNKTLKDKFDNIRFSIIIMILDKLQDDYYAPVSRMMDSLTDGPVIKGGKGFITEILINSILPPAYFAANKSNRHQLTEWYWTVPAINNYGKLKRRFPFMSQDYIWQQQGMLEYLHGNENSRQQIYDGRSAYNHVSL